MFYLNLFDGEAAPSAAEAEATAEETSKSEPSTTEDAGSQPEEKLYTKTDMSNAVKDRVKNFKAREEQMGNAIAAYGQLHEILADRYGTKDLPELINKVLGDDLYIEAEATKRNMSKEATKLAIDREYRERREFERAAAQAEAAKRQAAVNQWMQEGAELKATFPEFDLNTEFENPAFAKLLINGIPVRDAYMALHANDILKGGVHIAYEKGRESVASTIAANASRPLENGFSSKPAVNPKKDVSKLTNAEMDEIDARVRRGEKVDFR